MTSQFRHLAFENEALWVSAANDWIQAKIRQHRARSLYIPAGETPKPLYASWEKTHPAFLNEIQMIQIDDVATGPKKDLFRQFFRAHLPSYQKQIQFFDKGDQTADLAILGLGMNGHVAFHEPGLPAHFFSGCLELNEKTRQVLSLEKGVQGQTYGLGAFLKCKSILMIVKGRQKAEVVNRLIEKDLSLPASHLIDHPDFTLMTDF